jgi:hypothetical protein
MVQARRNERNGQAVSHHGVANGLGASSIGSVEDQAMSEEQPQRKLFNLPLGSRFRYLNCVKERRTYVLLGRGECGLVGDAPANNAGRVFQGLYSAAESREEFENMLVEFVPVCEAGPALLAALVMVRDADEDAIRDGLPRIPRLARASIDAAIALATDRTKT